MLCILHAQLLKKGSAGGGTALGRALSALIGLEVSITTKRRY